MWIKFMKDGYGNKIGGICWTDDDKRAQEIVNSGIAIRVLGPDGKLFEDSAPEVIIKQIASEDGLTFEQEERKMRNVLKRMKKDKSIREVHLGKYIDDRHLKGAEKKDKTLLVK